jgi:hypothetical protein
LQQFLNELKSFLEFTKNPREKAARYDQQLLTWENNPTKRIQCFLDNYIVVDVDSKDGKAIGKEEFRRLCTDEELPYTFVVKTPHGGRHYWFKRPDNQKYKSFTPIPGYKDIELKADVSTGSTQITHPLSKGYKIELDTEPVECPTWLLSILVVIEPVKTVETEIEKPIDQGRRHEALKRYAASLRYSGSSEAEILAALRIRNEARCIPPVLDSELIQLAKDFSKKGIAEKTEKRDENDPPIETYDGYAFETKEHSDIPGDIDIEETVKKEKPPRFYFTRLCNLKLTPMSYLVKNLIPEESTGQIYGDTGTWKTFYALDLACSVGTGKEFHGLKTKQAPVIYIAGEGKQQIVKRFKAWSIVNEIGLHDIDVYVSSGPVEMITRESVDELIITLKNLITDSFIDLPGIIMLDTFARNFGPGDENKTADMNLYINALDRIREHFRCTTISIHHTGLSSKDRARGSYANKCALDFEYYFDKDNKDENELLRVICTKMKDGQFPEPMAFTPHEVDLDIKNEYGENEHSLVLREIEYVPKENKGKKDQGKNQQIMLSILESHITDKGFDVEIWKAKCYEKGVSRASFSENKIKWLEEGFIKIDCGQVFLKK